MPPRITSCDTRRGQIGNHLNPSTNGVSRSESYKTSLFDDNTNLNGYRLDDSSDKLEVDTTITSDASTIRPDSNTKVVQNDKCLQLESVIDSLKRKLAIRENELMAKEKELTDLQLKQWSSDYLNDQLKSTIGKLEKENAQLKAMVFKFNNRANNTPLIP